MNFSRAAQRVHVVQSALSTSVGKLEKELGVELFDRSRQQIKITPAGALFVEHARRVIHAARLAKDSISDYRGQLSGIVEFGSLISSSTLDLPKILGEFHRDYPLVQIRLRNCPPGRAAHLSAIADGSLDLALVSAPDRFPANIEMRLLAEEPMLFVCRADHDLAQRDKVEIAELAEENLLGFPSDVGLRRVVDNAFSAAGITPRTPYEVPVDFHVAAAMARHGLASILVPASETGRFPDLNAVPVVPPWTTQSFLPGPRMNGWDPPAPSSPSCYSPKPDTTSALSETVWRLGAAQGPSMMPRPASGDTNGSVPFR
jgi:DNA-binding transcriptional LysR family regulator